MIDDKHFRFFRGTEMLILSCFSQFRTQNRCTFLLELL